jgi:hypothetical protein
MWLHIFLFYLLILTCLTININGISFYSILNIRINFSF